MAQAQHTVSSFDTELRELSKIILSMGEQAAQSVALATAALEKGNLPQAQQVVNGDRSIDNLQHRLEEQAISLIARRQPVAGDLREIIAGVRIANDFERIGDLSKNIAKRTLAISGGEVWPIAATGLGKLAERVKAQLARVIVSYQERDDAKALGVWGSDHEIDALHTSLFRELLTYMMENPRNIGSCAHLLFCAKNLERIGDHATNIAETVHYMLSGEFVLAERPRADDSSAMSTELPLPPWKG